MKPLSVQTAIVMVLIVVAGCKKEWEEESMGNDWYAAHPKEIKQLLKKCDEHGEPTSVCKAVYEFVLAH